MPERIVEGEIEEAGAGNGGAGDAVAARQPSGEQRRDVARLHPGAGGENHPGVAGDVAEGRIPRRLGRDAGTVEPLRQPALGGEGLDGSDDFVADAAKDVHDDRE